MTLPGFFEGTGMPDPGWWEALWPNPAKVLADTGVRAGMDVIDCVPVMAGSRSNSRR
jgi:hypothetical protein